MMRYVLIFEFIWVASGAYTYNRPAGTGTVTSNRPSFVPVVPIAPTGFGGSSGNHNISFVISAKDLPSKTFDTIDPYFKVYETSKTIIEPKKIATTEVIDNQPNPEFATVVYFDWSSGSNQTLIFKLKDSDRIKDNDIGTVNLDADQWAFKGFKSNLTLSNGGTILVQKTQPVRFKLYARGIPRLDPGVTGTGKSDPYVKCFWRRGATGEERKFHQTPVINDHENPDWDETIEFPNYIKGTDLWLVFKVLDSDGVNKDDKIGDTMLELDPFVEKRQTKIMRIGKQGQTTLGITPVS